MKQPSLVGAVLFDMDGVLIDSVGRNWQAINQALAPYGVTISDGQIETYLGRTLHDQIAQLADEFSLDLDADTFYETVQQLKKELFAVLEPKEGAVELLTTLQRAGIPCAVATSMPRDLTDERLRTAGIHHFFTAILTSDDVTAHKPAPDIYLAAAQALTVAPEACVVIEDAPAGIAAALAAGMDCIALQTPYVQAAQLHQATMIVPSLQTLIQRKDIFHGQL